MQLSLLYFYHYQDNIPLSRIVIKEENQIVRCFFTIFKLQFICGACPTIPPKGVLRISNRGL